MTSLALTAICLARSDTVMSSGMATSLNTGAVGLEKPCSDGRPAPDPQPRPQRARWAIAALHSGESLSAYFATLLRSIEKTSRALVLSESFRYAGIGAEVAAVIAEKAFQHLDAPVERLSPPNQPIPFSPTLEDAFLPGIDDIVAAVDRLSAW